MNEKALGGTIMPIDGREESRRSRRCVGSRSGDIDGKRWLTREAAGDYLGVHPRTLANWAAKGHGPRYSKPSGTACMYQITDLDAYLAAHMVHTDEQPEAA